MPTLNLSPKLQGQLRHGFRVAVSVALAFGIASWALHLQQGYWAVISALLVMQTSIGGTLGASRDRLVGTLLGAVVGGVAAFVRPETMWAEALALVLCAGSLTIVAARWPSLKVAPVTSVIMIVGNAAHATSLIAARDRVLEITLGSVIGVVAAIFIFPAPARQVVGSRVAGTLGDLARLLALLADQLDNPASEHAATLPVHDKIRADLTAVETAVTEVAHESTVRLNLKPVSPAIPRTLWRLRNDAVMIGRATDHAWRGELAERLHAPAVALLRAQSRTLTDYARAMLDGGTIEAPDLNAQAGAYRKAVEALDDAALPQGRRFEAMGQVFGLAYAFEAFNQNLTDLAARLREFLHPAED
ncbi:MAG TPA: FUSC family protein [Caulobacteraceae bacterium]|jgi:hypothetical protein|nr:FUSC family protein [Caulobacteraceae bacterium]